MFPLINREELILRWEELYGKVSYKGAWNRKPLGDGIRGVYHGPYEVPQLVEGNPTTSPRPKTLRISSFAWCTISA